MNAQGLALGLNVSRDELASACVHRGKGHESAPSRLPTFAELLDQAPDAVILVDAGGSIVYANRCVVHLFGVEPVDLLGLAVKTLIPEFVRAQYDPMRRLCHGAQHSGSVENARMTLTGRRGDGRELPVEIHFAPIERDGQRWTLAVVRDATEQHRILDEMRAARQVAVEMARVKGDFLGFAAHDLSQPVQTLELMLNAIEQRAQQSSEIAELSALATMSLARMRELLKMLLEISRIESGTLRIHEQPVRVAEVYEYLERQFGPVARSKALAFVTEPCHHIVEADPTLLRGMLSNLVANAIRYTLGGEVRLHSTTSADGRLCLSVCDTGIGIPAEHLHTIFQDFRRLAETVPTAGEGFGLGPGIVRRLSDLLGFPVTVQSILGRGSTFGIEIPASKVFSGRPGGTDPGHSTRL